MTTTHPALAQVLAELVTEAGGKPIIGDSPGGYHFYNRNVLDSVYETCGMTVYSGAVKNLFGIIPGSYKAEYHLRFEDTRDFADVLIDICRFAKPVLTVMDAVVGMEGYGPTNGSPRKIGAVLASSDVFALDVVASNMIGLKPGQVPTIQKSIERGLSTGDIREIQIVGEPVEKVTVKEFRKPTVKVAFNFYSILLPKFVSKALNRLIKPTPGFKYDVCKGCGVCAKSCPPKAIRMREGKPVLDYEKCIRCFCYHELCDHNAVSIKRPWFIRLVLR